MAKFLVTYHGAGMPETAEGREQAMAAFMAWAAKTGPALADPGAPLGEARTVSASAVSADAPAGPVAGYSVLEADDLDAAVALVSDHPFVARGGSLQVSRAIAP